MESILIISLIDTNILVHANNEDSLYHKTSKDLIENALNGDIEVALSIQNLVEFYAVITDKRRVEHPISPKRAKELLEFYHVNEFIKIIHPLHKTINTLANLIEKYKPKGQSIFDYLLIATMNDHGISQIFTRNTKDFKIFDFLKVVNPFT